MMCIIQPSCYYINIKVAVIVSVSFWLGITGILILLQGYDAYGGRSDILVPLLVWLPVPNFRVPEYPRELRSAAALRVCAPIGERIRGAIRKTSFLMTLRAGGLPRDLPRTLGHS